MKAVLIGIVITSILTGCGGASNSSSSSSSDIIDGGISKTSSTNYQIALKTFAETFRAMEFLLVLNDIAAFSGNSGNCPSGGNLSYSASVETLNNCVRKYPAEQAYQGSFNVTTSNTNATTTAITVNSIAGIKANSPSNTSTTQFSITSGNFKANEILPATGNEVTELSKATVTLQAGASSTYLLLDANSSTLNDGLSLTTSGTSAGPLLKISKPPVSLLVGIQSIVVLQPIKQINTNFPTSGSYQIFTGTNTTGICSMIQVDLLGSNNFKLTCNGESITKNWNDADIKAARAASIQ
jgi:hypothetical protein